METIDWIIDIFNKQQTLVDALVQIRAKSGLLKLNQLTPLPNMGIVILIIIIFQFPNKRHLKHHLYNYENHLSVSLHEKFINHHMV